MTLKKSQLYRSLWQSYDEQKAIVSILTDMDAEIEALEHRRDKARQVKQDMMQQLLAGRVWLINPEARA